MGFIYEGDAPDDIKARRLLAAAMLKRGMEPREIKHWTQGAAQLADALIGGLQMRSANNDYKGMMAEGNKVYTDALTNALARKAAPVSPDASAVSPSQPSSSSASFNWDQAEAPPQIPQGVEERLATDFSGSLIPNADVSPQDRDIAIRTVYGEAGNEPKLGKEAVAWAMLNRKKQNPGMSLSDVALAPKQFEPWGMRGDELEGLDTNSPEYASAASAVDNVLYGGAKDPTGGADHFYSPGAQAALGRNTPSWAVGQDGQDIGNHRFYSLGYRGQKPTQVAQNGPMMLGPDGASQDAPDEGIQSLITAIGHPGLTDQQRAVLGAFLKQKIDAQMPEKGLEKFGEGEVAYDKARGTWLTPPNNRSKPQSEIGRINSDLEKGLISPEEAATAKQEAANKRVGPGQRAVDTSFGKDYVDWSVNGGFADAKAQIGLARSVVDRIDTSGDTLSGPLIGRMPETVASMVNPASVNVRKDLEAIVQRSLRAILGAQFTEKEGERLLSRTYDPNAQEAVNSVRVKRLLNQIVEAFDAKKKASEYYESHGFTLNGYQGSLPSIGDFDPDRPGIGEGGAGAEGNTKMKKNPSEMSNEELLKVLE